jgi:hypothetical protein
LTIGSYPKVEASTHNPVALFRLFPFPAKMTPLLETTARAMHQSIEHEITSDAGAGLRQSFRQALARDLNLPEHHPTVVATLATLSNLDRLHATRIAPISANTETTLDAWWCVVAHTHALTTK